LHKNKDIILISNLFAVFQQTLIIVELKTVEEVNPVHKSQILTHLNFMTKPKGILVNFRCSNIFYEGQQTFITREYSKLPKE